MVWAGDLGKIRTEGHPMAPATRGRGAPCGTQPCFLAARGVARLVPTARPKRRLRATGHGDAAPDDNDVVISHPKPRTAAATCRTLADLAVALYQLLRCNPLLSGNIHPNPDEE